MLATPSIQTHSLAMDEEAANTRVEMGSEAYTALTLSTSRA